MGWEIPGADKIECKDWGLQARFGTIRETGEQRGELFFFFFFLFQSIDSTSRRIHQNRQSHVEKATREKKKL